MPLSARQRLIRLDKWWFAALLGAATASSACSKPAKKAVPAASASASASASTSVAASEASAGDAAGAVPPPASGTRPPVPRASLAPPPLTAPADAQLGPGGVQYQVLRAGTGESPGSVDTVLIDFSMWTKDGQLAFSSYPEVQPTGFSISSLAPNLRSLLTQLKAGSHVRFWVPRAALAGWKPPEWPDADLAFDLELLAVTHVAVKDSGGNAIDPVPSHPPDAAGPPATAEATPSGLRYVYLAHAEAVRLPTANDHLDLRATVYVVDGIEVKLLQSGIKTATTLARAPGKLAEVLKRLSPGDRVQIWLPAGQGKAIIPEVGQREMILDLSVSF